MTFKLIIIFSFIPLLANAKAEKSITNSLPSFLQLYKADPGSRDRYLKKFFTLTRSENYQFLNEILIQSDGLGKNRCLPALYGERNNPWEDQQLLINYKLCDQDLKSTHHFFTQLHNQELWQRIRIKLAFLCLDSPQCNEFMKKQEQIKRTLTIKTGGGK
ncbi:MAG: hypothetical protein AB8E15_10515 [Bdellovibrionales bacterium]